MGRRPNSRGGWVGGGEGLVPSDVSPMAIRGGGVGEIREPVPLPRGGPRPPSPIPSPPQTSLGDGPLPRALSNPPSGLRRHLVSWTPLSDVCCDALMSRCLNGVFFGDFFLSFCLQLSFLQKGGFWLPTSDPQGFDILEGYLICSRKLDPNW